MTFPEGFGLSLDLLNILECVGQREADTVGQHEGAHSSNNSKSSEEAEWNLLRDLPQLYQELADNRSELESKIISSLSLSFSVLLLTIPPTLAMVEQVPTAEFLMEVG